MDNNLVQGSEAWLELRKTKITGTDAAILMQQSPYKTPYELMEEKLGIKPPQVANEAMKRGSLMEESLRQQYCNQSGIAFLPSVKIFGEFQMASLDGLDIDERIILEIKTCKKEYFDRIKAGDIPGHFLAQVQHQLSCVPSAECVHLFCENKGETYLCVVPKDQAYIDAMLIKEEEFYRLLQKKEMPERTEKDIVEIKDDRELEDLIKRWRATAAMRKEMDSSESELKKQILEYTDDGNCKAYGVTMTKSYVQVIDYKKACEDAKINLAEYKKPMQIRWIFKDEKKGDNNE